MAADRLVLGWICWLFPNARDALAIVRPESVVRWHRAGFRSYWRWKSRGRAGRPALSAEIRNLIREMSIANPLWGAPRIHGELLKLGIDVGQTSVAKYMARTRRPPSQGWKTFLRNHADGIVAMDLFVVPTVSFRLLYGLLIMGHGRRQILWLGVTAHPTAEWIANQLTQAYGWEQAPRHLIRDRDSCYGSVFTRRLRSLGIRDHPTSPRSPWQNGYAERLIGSDPPGMPRPRHRVRGAASASCAVMLHGILQYGAHTSILEQGHSDPPRPASSGTRPSTIRSRRSAPPVRADLIYDRDNHCQRSNPVRTTPLLCSGMIFGRHNNAARTHLSLRKDAPIGRVVQSVGCIKCRPVLVACIANTHGFDYDRDSRRLRTAAKARRAMSIMAAI